MKFEGVDPQGTTQKYTSVKKLGQGGYGKVYRCRKEDSNEDYAVKVVKLAGTKLDENEKTMASDEIQREVEALEILDHPCITKIHFAVYRPDVVCVVLELYKGGDMMHGMMRHWNKAKNQMIPMEAVQHLTRQMWDAVAYLHSKWYVHCDVKADNFMMDIPEVENTANRIYLGDFGSAIELKPGARLSRRTGTEGYHAPEVFKGDYAHKVDCWAVGVTMYGLCTGNFPFSDEQEVNQKELRIPPRAGEEGGQLIRWALQRDEEERCEAAAAAKHAFNSGRAPSTVVGRDTELDGYWSPPRAHAIEK